MSRSWSRLGPFAVLAAAAALAPAFAQIPAQPGVAVPLGPRAGGQPPKAEPALSDEEALRQAGLHPGDGAKLVGYLKQRTLSESDQGRIKEIIARFGADDFEARVAAVAEVGRFGPAAIGPLKAAEQDPDPEVAYRAGVALKRLEKIPHAAAAAAAVRAVVKLNPPDAAAALIGFLPLADSDALAEEIREALVALAVRDGKPEPALLAALADPSPVRRGAAYVALVEGGPAGERVRIKEAFPQVLAAARKEADPDAKFRGLWAVATVAREKEVVPDLIGLIPQMPRGRLWQFEELLLHAAGSHPPGGRFGKTPEKLAEARDAWAAWWAKKGPAVDLVKFPPKLGVAGCLDLVEMDATGLGQGRVVSLGPDLKEKWRLPGMSFAWDARVLPGGRVLVVEQNRSQVSEWEVGRDRPLAARPVNQPVAAELLPNGGLLVVSRLGVFEFEKEDENRNRKPVFTYLRRNANGQQLSDVVAGRRLPNGETVFVTTTPNGPNCFRLDPKGAETGTPLTLGRVMFNAGMDLIGEDTILVCEQTQVAEYDLKTGKLNWKFAVPQPSSCQRLANGNTLIAAVNRRAAIEVSPEGEELWEYQARDGLRVTRAYRR